TIFIRKGNSPPQKAILQRSFRRGRLGLAFGWSPSHGPMESLLVKIFALALALSQVTTTPDAVKTQFDRSRDQEEVSRLLSAGCTHMRKAFDIEDINLDELIAKAMDDPQA